MPFDATFLLSSGTIMILIQKHTASSRDFEEAFLGCHFSEINIPSKRPSAKRKRPFRFQSLSVALQAISLKYAK